MSIDPISLALGALGGGGSQTTVTNTSESGIVFNPTISIGGSVEGNPYGSLSQSASQSVTPSYTTGQPGGFGLPSLGGSPGRVSTAEFTAAPVSGSGSLFTNPIVLAVLAGAGFLIWKGF